MSTTTSHSMVGPRVVKTKINLEGTSIFESDSSQPLFHPFGPGASGFVTIDTRGSIPVNVLEPPTEYDTPLPRCPPGGIIFCMSEIPPHYSVPIHRTQTLDYAIVTKGEIWATLDGGEEKLVKAGEVIVQGGANHGYENRTDDVVRIMFILMGAEKIVLENGDILEETAFKNLKSS